ncbi:POU Class 2 homeobox-associating factor 3-like isoform X1 [Oncorhynchus keta]|uniref:POU Class 2 homeobox-associating factor 3-like isoform X1 n=1 Tax=Oncorhynchus keta TaxID=8018 RepID=UPI00227C7684|nr:POU Class 2 homeobox-associating factor 3-like isoform X1 [Oncorhynchus keta]
MYKSTNFLDTEKPKVYEGVRVKITVKELLEKRRARQMKLSSEYANSWYQDAVATPSLSLVPEPSAQPWPCEDNPSDYGTECLSLYSDNFSSAQQTEPAAYSEPCNYTHQQPWSLGLILHKDYREGQASWSSLETWTPACTPEKINPLDTHHLPSSLQEYSDPVDPTYISLNTNVTQYDTSVYSNPTESTSTIQWMP